MDQEKNNFNLSEKWFLHFVKDLMMMSRSTRIKISIASVMLYILLFYVMFNILGHTVAILIVIPTIMIPFLFGTRVGVISVMLLNLILTPVLFHFFTPLNFMVAFKPGVLVGTVAGLLVAAIIGFLYFLFLEIFKLTEKLNKLNETDFLTNIYNRRTILAKAEQQLQFFQRQNKDLGFYLSKIPSEFSVTEKDDFKDTRTVSDYVGVMSCAMIDFDYFKNINDTYGHLAGDEVLSFFGEVLADKKILRETDLAGRYGGEEFIIIFPGTSARNAVVAVEKIKNKFKEHTFSVDSNKFNVTFSCGISQLSSEKDSLKNIIIKSDNALYEAKKSGRDKIVIHS